MSQPAVLALASGTVFHGRALGAEGLAVGEVVFNTSMSGYQEILTDPSYCRQIVTLTYPHIGNVGTNPEDQESPRIWASGLVVRDAPMQRSNWRATQSLEDYLCQRGIVAIADIDTRQLTRLLREQGAQSGCIAAGVVDEAHAIAAAREFLGLQGADLAAVVSTNAPYTWDAGLWHWPGGEQVSPMSTYHVVVLDFGVKQNILRMLAERGCKLTVMPARTPARDVTALQPDGVLLANGPGDPAACGYAIDTIKGLLETGVPMFGICLGHQLLALAHGARTMKMKFGHHGANHPVLELATGRVMITSQNHGFAVDEASLPVVLETTHRSLFDGSLQGIRRNDRPVFSFQGHPEASPGPSDAQILFDRFIELIRVYRAATTVTG